MDWSNWISIGISALALFVSLWGYFVYDRPIKRLQKKDLEQKALEKKQAIIKLDYCLNKYNNPIFVIENVGQADAKNVVLKSLAKEPAFYNEGATNQHIVGTLRACDSPQTLSTIYRRKSLTMEVTWDDDSATGRTEIFELNCNARS